MSSYLIISGQLQWLFIEGCLYNFSPNWICKHPSTYKKKVGILTYCCLVFFFLISEFIVDPIFFVFFSMGLHSSLSFSVFLVRSFFFYLLPCLQSVFPWNSSHEEESQLFFSSWKMSVLSCSLNSLFLYNHGQRLWLLFDYCCQPWF